MSTDSLDRAQTEAPDEKASEGVRCDFCGEQVTRVMRIALDGAYERLRTPHKVQYACQACSKRKEAVRQKGRGS